MYINNNNKCNSKNVRCVNCGEIGHIVKECNAPVTSFGIIAFKTCENECQSDTNIQLKEIIKSINIKPVDFPKVKFLMIQRKDTMGYIDFIRGKYSDEPIQKLKKIMICLNEMTFKEKDNLLTQNFDKIWWNLWVNRESKCYKNEYESAKNKYYKLDIPSLVSKSTTSFWYTELGIPKGRKNIKEQNLRCAEREFSEETGFTKDSYDLVENYPVIVEEFTGTDEVEYRHVYYLAKMRSSAHAPRVDFNNKVQTGEVVNIGWFSIEECLALIRPYDIAKKNIMQNLANDINCNKSTVKEDTIVLYNKLTDIYKNGKLYLIDSLQ